tara:strand:+ start:68 stop:1426 length:1359 start_codon:yes stop_codon:yes gene_type:complete
MIFNNAEQVIKDSIEKLKTINADARDKQKDMCVDYYQYANTKRYITQYFSGSLTTEIPLYTVNMTRRLIDKISLVYKNPPERGIEDERYTDITIDKNFTMKKVERIHNLLGTIALQVIWKDDKFVYVPRFMFEPIFDIDDRITPKGIIYPVSKTSDSIYQTQEDEYVYWDNEQHFKFDSKGNVIHINEDDLNPYGVLPFTFLQPNHQIDEFWNDGKGKDICNANRQIDVAMTMLQHHIRKAGGQYVIQGQVDTNNIELGLNKVVVIDDGQMQNLNPNVSIQSIVDGIKFQLQQVAINHHISFDFGLNGSKSGVALKIENVSLLEQREDDVEKFNRFEKELYKVEQVISLTENNLSLPDDFSINYSEIEFPDPERERDDWEWKFKHGLADKIDYLMHYDPDGLPTREDAEAYLAERRKSTTIVKEQGTNAENIFQATKKVEDKPKEKVEDEPR